MSKRQNQGKILPIRIFAPTFPEYQVQKIVSEDTWKVDRALLTLVSTQTQDIGALSVYRARAPGIAHSLVLLNTEQPALVSP